MSRYSSASACGVAISGRAATASQSSLRGIGMSLSRSFTAAAILAPRHVVVIHLGQLCHGAAISAEIAKPRPGLVAIVLAPDHLDDAVRGLVAQHPVVAAPAVGVTAHAQSRCGEFVAAGRTAPRAEDVVAV